MYLSGKYVSQDINKAIHYFTLAANQGNPDDLAILGDIYYTNQYAKQNMEKAIHYYTLAANQDHSRAQFSLGIFYYSHKNLPQDIKKGMWYIMLASKNGNKQANFSHGFLLHEGKFIERNIDKAIHYYKEASSFNNQYAKNNLGIIFKHGYGNIKKHIGSSIEYFREAIRMKNDYLSMYNLSHIYFYDETIKGDINEAIELLIKSSKGFAHSRVLLSLVLFKLSGFKLNLVKQIIETRGDIPSELSEDIYRIINNNEFYNKSIYDNIYKIYKNQDFVYNIDLEAILTTNLETANKKEEPFKYPNAKMISSEFYEGLGKDLP